MSESKITNSTEVNTTELACVLGITGRRIRQMAEDGQLERVSQGRFNLCASVQRYNDSISLGKNTETKKNESEKLKAEVAIKKAKATRAVLEAQELQGKMHRSEDVESVITDLVYVIRGMLTALPGRLATAVVSAGSSAEAANIIRNEVFKILDELSNYDYDPVAFEERVRKRMNWDDIDAESE